MVSFQKKLASSVLSSSMVRRRWISVPAAVTAAAVVAGRDWRMPQLSSRRSHGEATEIVQLPFSVGLAEWVCSLVTPNDLERYTRSGLDAADQSRVRKPHSSPCLGQVNSFVIFGILHCMSSSLHFAGPRSPLQDDLLRRIRLRFPRPGLSLTI